jgi:hypothetical protein
MWVNWMTATGEWDYKMAMHRLIRSYTILIYYTHSLYSYTVGEWARDYKMAVQQQARAEEKKRREEEAQAQYVWQVSRGSSIVCLTGQ